MSTEQLKSIKEQIVRCTEGQLGDLQNVDTHELGEAIDMIKDLSESIYYCTITESMEKSDEIQKMGATNINYYTSPTTAMYTSPATAMYPYPPDYEYRDMNKKYMYYSDGNTPVHYNPSSSMEMRRDPKEGTSYMRRRMYMEGKEQHRDTNSQLRELEAYLQELSSDIVEMIQDSSPEEKSVLRQKMTNLANKIQ